VWAVPSHTTIRALEGEPPASSGRGRRPRRPWPSVEAWRQALADEPGLRSAGRDGSKGPLGVETVKRRVVSRTHRRQQGDEELLVVIRDRDQQPVVKVDDDLSNAVPAPPLGEWARGVKAAQRSAECLQRSTSETGLADDEVRHWPGWQPHQTLSLLATWFLVRETARGKNMAPGDALPPDAPGHCDDRARGVAVQHEVA
jgi:hypothetical protein